MRAPPESLIPIRGIPFFSAKSINLHIFFEATNDKEPPNTVKF